MSGSSPSRSPIIRTLTPSRCSVARSLRMKRLSRPNRSPISVAGRDQFSELKEKIVRYRMPSSLAARTTRRKAATPRRWPSARGRPRAAAQRPFPSMMIATCNGTVRSDPSVAGAAALDIIQFQDQSQSLDRQILLAKPRLQCLGLQLSNGEDFLFLGRKQLLDFSDHGVGCLLHIVGKALLIVFGDLVILLELLDGIDPVATDMANSDLSRFGILMSDLHQLLAALLVDFRNPKAQHLPFGGGAQTKVGID